MKFNITFRKSLSLIFSILLSLVTGLAIIKPEMFITYGYFGLFGFAVFGGQGAYILPFTISGFNPLLFMTTVSIGMTISDSVGYLLGRTSRDLVILNRFDAKMKRFVERFGLIGITLVSMIPIPISNGIIGGFLKINYSIFMLGTFIGKFLLLAIVYTLIAVK